MINTCMKLSDLQEDVQHIDLSKLYDKFNKKYFNRELPDIKIKWSNRRRSMGTVLASRNNTTGIITIKHLEISKHLNIDEDKLNALMVHEMIHVYIMHTLQLNEKNGGHGTEFHKKLDELNRKTPFVIPATEDENDFGVSDHVIIKPTVVILRTGSDGTWIHAISETGFKKNHEGIIARFVQGMQYEIIVSTSNTITQIPVARTLTKKGMPYYKLKDNEIQSIRDGMTKMMVKISKDGKITS